MEAIDLIRELRRLGLTQQSIAKRSGLSQGAISHIETGRRKNVFAVTRDKLAALLHEVTSEVAADERASGAMAREGT
ncbi:MAG: XRE family transcriptional regulator [Paraburkholderia sp.]|nr:MAG: XRE family transcriptional regulator [Paraburkholderia sp.]